MLRSELTGIRDRGGYLAIFPVFLTGLAGHVDGCPIDAPFVVGAVAVPAIMAPASANYERFLKNVLLFICSFLLACMSTLEILPAPTFMADLLSAAQVCY